MRNTIYSHLNQTLVYRITFSFWLLTWVVTMVTSKELSEAIRNICSSFQIWNEIEEDLQKNGNRTIPQSEHLPIYPGLAVLASPKKRQSKAAADMLHPDSNPHVWRIKQIYFWLLSCFISVIVTQVAKRNLLVSSD